MMQESTSTNAFSEINKSFYVKEIKDNLLEVKLDMIYRDPVDSTRQMEALVETIIKYYRKHPDQKFSILGVESEKSVVNNVTTESREVAFQLFEDLQTERIALINSNRVMRYLAKLIAKLSGLDSRLKFFKDRKSALNWLKTPYNGRTS